MNTQITGDEMAYPDPFKESTGLTIRQEFAARAINGILAKGSFNGDILNAAKEAVRIADALILELNKP